MPGIYVRETSWLDWTQKGKHSILTVPGSYWLCHKSNIYKFIFRYHRPTRNIKQFNFGRELMKVVRRVIKNQPRQGQQFSTKHLLITYSYASWTRQDKMFALIKFKERSVEAFSHAFVLTIKLCCPLESINQNTKYIVATPVTGQCLDPNIENTNSVQPDENKLEKKSKKDLLHSLNNDILENTAQSDNTQEKILELNNQNVNSDDSLKKTSMNKESVKQKTNNENTSKFVQNSELSFQLVSSESNTEFNNKVKENKSSRNDKSKLKKGNENKNSVLLNNNSNVIKVDHACIENKNNKQSGKHDTKKKSISYRTNLTLSSSDKNSVDNINTDSANLPYQYLIEKEIENVQHKIPDSKSYLQKTNSTNKLCNQYGQDSKKHKLGDVNEDLKDLFGSKKRKVDNITSRSSDITDLVMEGLMFTIRQGQDTVAVIEQKTKLEMDEVLENSEKIETKEGEKCLRNSSLLGLENLITMIDLPQQVGNEQKCQNAGIKESISRDQSLIKHSSNNIKQSLNDIGTKDENIIPKLKHIQSKSLCNNSASASTSFSNNNENLLIANKSRCLTTHDNYKLEETMNFMNHKKLNYNKEEEEDIIPEALQNDIFQSPIYSPQELYKFKEKCTQNKNVIINEKELTNSETTNDECTSFFSKNLLPKRSPNAHSSNNELIKKSITNQSYELCNSNIKNKINIPTIISNQTISMKEIPLPLQKMFKNKLQAKHISFINNNEINKSNINVSEEEEETDFNVQSENKILDSDSYQNIDDNEDMSPTTSEVQTKSTSTSERSSEKVETVLADKIKDITQEFYQDLPHLQKKMPLHNKKHLRSRTKSLNILGNETYGDMPIEMMKLFQDITRGAKVVVTRISTKKCS